MPPRKKRVRDDEESEEETPVETPSSARKRSRVPASASKTRSTRKKTASPPRSPTESSTNSPARDESEDEVPVKLTRSSRKSTTASSSRKANATPLSRRTPKKPITPPSPVLEVDSPQQITNVTQEKKQEESAEKSKPKKGTSGNLDNRFALVDHNEKYQETQMVKKSEAVENSLYRYMLPAIYVISFLLLILIATGTMAPAIAMKGAGRPTHVSDLLSNVTNHMKTHLSSLVSNLEENSAHLHSERISLNAIHDRLTLLESDESRVKQRLEDAIAKVDRLTRGDKKSKSGSTKAKLSLAELDSLKVTARDLEKKVRGHLENIAKTIVSEAKGQKKDLEDVYGGGALSEDTVQRVYFEKWVEQAYNEMRSSDETYVPKYQADALIKKYVQTFTEAECSGLHDFAGFSNGGRVLSSSKSFGESRSWLNPLASSVTMIKNPDVAIKRGNEQGECWPMAGTSGSFIVELANSIHIGSITLMHIHPQLAPNGDVSSALKDFKVWAYPSDGGEKFEIVSSSFDNSAGCGTFAVSGGMVENGLVNQPVKRVALEVLNNHGREDLTCIYRFMVHGQP